MQEWAPLLQGLLQGLTEFLPISSSGHLFLLEKVVGLKQNSLSLIILLHGATLLSILTLFFKDIKSLAFSLNKKASYSLILKVFVSCIPLGLLGFFFKKIIEQSFQTTFVALGFLTTALLLLSLWFKKASSSYSSLKDLSYLQAFVVGVFQAIAVFPGFSRSGWTISASLFMGLSPYHAVYYSFLISIPACLGVLLIEIGSQFHLLNFSWSLAFGFLTAYISGTICLYFLSKVVQKQKFFLFGFYLLPLSFYLLLF
ncbi:MAG: undecaprenyl-diphosphate phosphatase [Bdellovibrionales bacterium]